MPTVKIPKYRKRKPVKSPHLVIRKSKIAGRGGFAKKDIPKGTTIIEYVGPKLTKPQADLRADQIFEAAEKDPAGQRGHVYVFEINSRHDIDGSVSWNTAKWINHSCNPNAEAVTDRGHIYLEAIRDIKKGEEVTYNYGYSWAYYKEHPCRCRSKNCVKYILEKRHWWRLKKAK